MADGPRKTEQEIILADGRYPLAAYVFLRDGMERVGRNSPGGRRPGEGHHVTGEQCCIALRDLAIERWGRLARTVLTRWNVHGTIDFGNMVYLLIKHEFMAKTPSDSIEDFREVYDFREAFAVDEDFRLTE